MRLFEVIKSDPIDITARLVTQPGISFEMRIDPYQARKVRHGLKGHIILGPEMRGATFGRFTVIGRTHRNTTKGPLYYSCRCACGRFEIRKHRAIFNKANVDDCCLACRRLEQMKRGQTYRELGYNIG